mgnify:CR=1 FL=1
MPDSDRTVFYRPPQAASASVGDGAGSVAARRGFGTRATALLERHRWARAALIGLLGAAAALAAGRGRLAEHLEVLTHDARVRATAEGGESPLIEVVDYDQLSIELLCTEKQLPRFGLWPRSIHKRMIEYLERGHPKVIAFDILFSTAGAGDMLDDEDRSFAECCARAGNVVSACNFFASSLDGERARAAYPPPPGPLAERFSLGPSAFSHPPSTAFSGATWPYAELMAGSRGVGSIQLETDRDSVTRQVSPVVMHHGRLWPALSTAVAVAASGRRAVDGSDSTICGRSLTGHGPRLLRWYGPGVAHREGQTPRYRAWPAHLLFDSETALRRNAERKPGDPELPVPVDPARFRDKIVLIASNAPGSYDLRYTPFGYEPGVFVHAAAIESLMRGDAVSRAGWPWTALAAAALALAAAFSFAVGRARRAALAGSGSTLLLGGGYVAAAFWLYGRGGLWIDLVAPLAALGLVLAGSLLAGYLVEGRQARVMRRGMARFLSPEVLREIGGDLDSLRPGMGRKREITVMFCDARGFTGISERLSPEAAVEVLDAYLGAMSDCILAEGGTLSKYIGDGIMAFWNAPADCPDHPERAARAALAMVRAQEGIKARLAATGRPAFDIGVGLHVGEAVVGTVGSEKRLDYTAIGDTVNLASRVEGLTKDFKVRICVTGDFAERAGGRFEFRGLGRVQVKGRSAGVEILELVAERTGVPDGRLPKREPDPFEAAAAANRDSEEEEPR